MYLLTSFIALISLVCSTSDCRYFWLVRDHLDTPAHIDSMLAVAQAAGANGVIAQVVGRAEAYYTSDILPAAPQIEAGFDPLEYLVARAGPMGIEVHAWINAFLVWSAPYPPSSQDHVLNSHPEWFLADLQGKSTINYSRGECDAAGLVGATLSPAVPEVKELLADISVEIATNYRVSGIHLDYIRYPNNSFGFENISRSRFFLEYCLDPVDLFNWTYSTADQEFQTQFDALWEQWKRDQVTSTVLTVRTELRRKAPDIVLSCAVMADPFSARSTFSCDWPAWTDMGAVDFVCPMAYTTNPQRAQELTTIEISESGPEYIVHGIAVYNQPVVSAITGAYEALVQNCGGVCVYSLNTFNMNDCYILQQLWDSPNRAYHSPDAALFHQLWQGGVSQ